VKCKGERRIKEVPLINLLSREDLKKLNIRFNRNYKPEKVESFARIIEETRLEELKKLMESKPTGGIYGL
jgi:hypothetical protein